MPMLEQGKSHAGNCNLIEAWDFLRGPTSRYNTADMKAEHWKTNGSIRIFARK
jgi:hypothetical protein